jgi:outer membrane protein assembly factor BamB
MAHDSLKWTLKTMGTTYLSTPAISDSLVFFAPGDYDRNIYAVWLSDGEVYWSSAGNPITAKTAAEAAAQIPVSLLNQLRPMGPLQRGEWLKYYSKHGAAFAKTLSADKSNSADADFIPGDNTIRTSSVAVDSNNVYVIQRELGFTDLNDMLPVSRYTLLALDKATGKEQWRFPEYLSAAITGYNSSPIVAGNKIFFGWGEGRVYALNAKTGSILWEDSLQGDIISSPAISNGMLYMATMDGYLYAFNLTDTPQAASFNDGTYCYPNPASTQSCIQYYIEKTGTVEARIYDSAERLVKIYRADNVAAGAKDTFCWDVSNAANGIYFAIVNVEYDDGSNDKKILKIAVLK